MARSAHALLVVLVWVGLVSPVPAGNKILDTSGTYETLMGLLEESRDRLVTTAIDLDQVQTLELWRQKPGLHYVFSGQAQTPATVNQAKKLVVLIHGVDEPGSNWDTPLRLLAREPDLLVFFFVWTKWNRPQSIEYWISRDISRLARAFVGKVPEMEVVAHSAGGLLLLQSLCKPAVSRNCQYDPKKHVGLTIKFHTLASPLGGFGIHGTAMGSLMAGAVTTHVGSDVIFYDVIKDLDLTIWYTSFEADGVLKQQAGRDMRFPYFSREGPEYKREPLIESTHDSAILDGLIKILKFEKQAGNPGDGPWQLIYKADGKVTKPKPAPTPENNEWKKVPR